MERENNVYKYFKYLINWVKSLPALNVDVFTSQNIHQKHQTLQRREYTELDKQKCEFLKSLEFLMKNSNILTEKKGFL